MQDLAPSTLMPEFLAPKLSASPVALSRTIQVVRAPAVRPKGAPHASPCQQGSVRVAHFARPFRRQRKSKSLPLSLYDTV